MKPLPALVLLAVSCGRPSPESPPRVAPEGVRSVAPEGVRSVAPGETARGSTTGLAVPAIQGRGPESPRAGTRVRTSGIVTLVTRDHRTFWLQDPEGDGDPATSDGLRVYRGSSPGTALLPGDRIEITGRVEEWGRGVERPVTQISPPLSITILSRGEPRPEPVELRDLPDTDLPGGERFWESLEGMRVRVGEGVVVAPTTKYGVFAMLTAADAREGSGFVAADSVIVLRSLGSDRVDFNPERILVDDATLRHPPVRPGDRVREVVGVADFAYGEFRIQPERVDVEARAIPDPPVSRRTGPGGDLTITTFNLENLFDTKDDPATRDEGSTPTMRQLETKLGKLALAWRLELRLPAIAVVEEIENEAILQRLADRVNEAAGTTYVATSRGSSDARGIEVGFLWDAARVHLRDARLLRGWTRGGREPLEGTFEIRGDTLVILGNHWTSKGGDDPLHVRHPPRRRRSERVRREQARRVRRRADEILRADPEARLLVAGDCNDFPFPEPGEGEDHPLGILEGRGGPAPLRDLLSPDRVPGAWTILYQGNAEVLDHILVSRALARRVAGCDVLHINAGWPASLGADASTPLRSSDHDPVEVRFRW